MSNDAKFEMNMENSTPSYEEVVERMEDSYSCQGRNVLCSSHFHNTKLIMKTREMTKKISNPIYYA